MSNVPDARNKFITGQSFGALPQTLITVTAGQIWRLYWASIQLSVESSSSATFPPPQTLDSWIEIQGGDVLVAAAEIITDAIIHSSVSVSMDLGGRAISGGTVVRVVSSALPANFVARVTAGILFGTS